MQELKQKILSLKSNNKTITNEQLCDLLMTENIKLNIQNINNVCDFIEKEQITLVSENNTKKRILKK